MTLSSEYFSTFHHCTCRLSDSWLYLALDGAYHLLRAALANNPTRRRTRPRARQSVARACHPPRNSFPGDLDRRRTRTEPSRTPHCTTASRPPASVLGSSHFTRRYWGNPIWFLFLHLMICLSSVRNPAPPRSKVLKSRSRIAIAPASNQERSGHGTPRARRCSRRGPHNPAALETTPRASRALHARAPLLGAPDERPRLCEQIIQPTLESTELADRDREPPFAFNLSMIVCVLQFANCLGFYPGLHRPTSRVIRCHGSSMFIWYTAGPRAEVLRTLRVKCHI